MRQVIEAGEQKATVHKFKLAELIKVPMQRVLKYPLIVDRLMKKSGKNHPDYKELEYVHETLLDLNSYINQTKCDMERTIKPVAALQAKIDQEKIRLPKKLEEYGGLILDCTVAKWGEQSSTQTRKIHVYVFNLAIVAFELDNNLRPRKMIWNMDIKHITPGNAEKRSGLRLLRGKEFEVRLKTTLGSGDQTVVFKQEKAATDFQKSIQKAKAKFEKGGCDFELCDVPACPGELPTCCACQKLFHGMKSQGFRKINDPEIFVHEKCLDDVRNGRVKPVVAPPTPERPPNRQPSLGRAVDVN